MVKQTNKKTVGGKKEQTSQTQGLPKPLPFPLTQKCFDNKAHLTQIWKSVLQLPSLFQQRKKLPCYGLQQPGLTWLVPSHGSTLSFGVTIVFKTPARKLNISHMASKGTSKKGLPGLLKCPPYARYTLNVHLGLVGCWNHAWSNCLLTTTPSCT